MPRDPLDASTLEARRAGDAKEALAPAIRVVFRADRPVREPALLLGREPLLAGRGPAAGGVSLGEDPLASREHARFAVEGGAIVVRDLGSRNGVQVNGEGIEHASLVDGDVVRLGSTLLVVRHQDRGAVDVPDEDLLGVSPSMQRIRVAVRRAGPSNATILVEGETGTGKEVVARALHRESRRRGPFVEVNCAAISEGLAESLLFGHVAGSFTGAVSNAEGFFRAATGGTLFLDEVGDMLRSLQPKLLRVLETRSFTPVGSTKPVSSDVRVVAATNVGLEQRVEDGTFRGDLFARLAQLRIDLAPLRERREDVLLLLEKHLGDGAPKLSPDLAEALLLHGWPFNVRELVSVATQLRVWGAGRERLELDLLRDHFARGAGAPSRGQPAKASEETETAPADGRALKTSAPQPPRDKAALTALLREHDNNLASVARAIGRSRTQLYRLLEQHGIDRSTLREK